MKSHFFDLPCLDHSADSVKAFEQSAHARGISMEKHLHALDQRDVFIGISLMTKRNLDFVIAFLFFATTSNQTFVISEDDLLKCIKYWKIDDTFIFEMTFMQVWSGK